MLSFTGTDSITVVRVVATFAEGEGDGDEAIEERPEEEGDEDIDEEGDEEPWMPRKEEME